MNQQKSETDNLWVKHYSVADWTSPELWGNYFGRVQEILAVQIKHLDMQDPVARRFDKIEEADPRGNAKYVTFFDALEESKYFFGECADQKIRFSFNIQKNNEKVSNSLNWYFDPPWYKAPKNIERLDKLFVFDVETLNPFYAESDLISQMNKDQGKGTYQGIQSELAGVFWRTYFNKQYVEYFGKERFSSLPEAVFREDGSCILKLSESPLEASKKRKIEIQNTLGKMSFWEPRKPFLAKWREPSLRCFGAKQTKKNVELYSTPKEKGQYALSLKQLLANGKTTKL